MEEVRDCVGKLVCMVDADSGLVERITSKEQITAVLSVGDKIAFETNNIYTELELIEGNIFYVNSFRN